MAGSVPHLHYPEDLPISARREDILRLLRAHQVVVIAGETGSGKTTQLPKLCLEAGLARSGQIACTQPRRVAALSISQRVAEELGVSWGREVGCKIRFRDDTSPETRIKFMTDGILLAEIQTDPLLRSYSAILLDEAHERSLNIDFLLGHLRGVLAKRPELKLIVTSATIDTESFSKAFGNAPTLEVSGRLWPVEVRYRPLEGFGDSGGEDLSGYLEAAVRVTEEVLLESHEGDVLVFLPTERDIREGCEWLEDTLGRGTEVLGLFGRMPSAEQQRIFTPGPRRRVILATNVAETSLTLPRIRYVIDAGLARMSRYNPRTRTKRLPVEAVSQSSARQRAGRAGRVGPGIAIRLYSEEDFTKRPLFTQPEIQRANLAEVILRMKAFRLGDIETFPFLDPPVSAAIRGGYTLLHELGALDELNQLTPLGRELARLPVDPTLGRMLLQARKENALPEVLVIAAGLSVPDPRERPQQQMEAAQAAQKRFLHPLSDFLSLLEVWRQSPQAEGRGATSALKRYCKAHFLSFIRMREWADIHRQLADAFPREETTRTRDAENAPSEPSSRAFAHPRSRAAASSPRDHSRDTAQPLSAPPPPQTGPPTGRSRQRPQKKEGNAPFDPVYTAVHRAILSGLISQIAQREERNRYKAGGSRIVQLFPGSGLFEREEKSSKKRPPAHDPKNPRAVEGGQGKTRQPEWIMAAEIVETSRLFARSVAAVSPEWILDLGSHLCESRFSEPAWRVRAGRVLALERVLLHGLEVWRKSTDYGRVDPVHATELFIRGALVEAESHVPLRFFAENEKTIQKVETSLTRVRHSHALDLHDALYRFYAERITGVSSLHDLNRFVEEKGRDNPKFLHLTEEDLLRGAEVGFDHTQFPDEVRLDNSVLPLAYAYDPGEEHDGVTVRVPLPVAGTLSASQIQWLVPGLRRDQVLTLLRALPKHIRRALHPIEARAEELAVAFDPGRADFLTALAEFLTRRYRVHVRRTDWPQENSELPAHLCPRVEIVDNNSKRPLASGRDLESLQKQIDQLDARSGRWEQTARKWERSNLSSWDFGDLPESVFVEEVGGVPLLAYPGLEAAGAGVHVRLHRKRETAESLSPAGVLKLAEIALARELPALRKELQTALQRARQGAGTSAGARNPASGAANPLQSLSLLQTVRPDKSSLKEGPSPAFADPIEAALRCILVHAFRWTPALPLHANRFTTLLESGRNALPELIRQLAGWSRQIFELRDALQASPKRYRGMEEDVARIAPPSLFQEVPFERLRDLPRYLRAVQIRAERAALKPAHDAEKAARITPYQAAAKTLSGVAAAEFRWLLEEWRVSVFAQELGTACSVSPKKLDAFLEEARSSPA